MSRIRHFLALNEIARRTLRDILDHSRAMKKKRKGAAGRGPLAGKTIAMVFDRPSTRTRVSFDVGMRQLGESESLALIGQEMHAGRGGLSPTPRGFCRATSTAS